MARYAILGDGTVENIIEADAAFAASVGAIPAGDDTNIGDAWDGSTFSRPAHAVDPEAVRAQQWERIKAERDRRKFAGFQVGAEWFHSDPDSRTQQLMLYTKAVSGKPVPAVPWKTLGGAFTPMSAELAEAIGDAAAAHDIALFARAEALRAEVMAAEDPGAVDILAGWPAVFGE